MCASLCHGVPMKAIGQLSGVGSLIPSCGFQRWNPSVCPPVPLSAAGPSHRPPTFFKCMRVYMLLMGLWKGLYFFNHWKCHVLPQILNASLVHPHSLPDPAWPILSSISCNVSEKNKRFGEVFSVNSMLWGKRRNQLMSIHKHPSCDYSRGHGCKQFTVNPWSSHRNEGILSSPNASVVTAFLHHPQERAF